MNSNNKPRGFKLNPSEPLVSSDYSLPPGAAGVIDLSGAKYVEIRAKHRIFNGVPEITLLDIKPTNEPAGPAMPAAPSDLESPRAQKAQDKQAARAAAINKARDEMSRAFNLDFFTVSEEALQAVQAIGAAAAAANDAATANLRRPQLATNAQALTPAGAAGVQAAHKCADVCFAVRQLAQRVAVSAAVGPNAADDLRAALVSALYALAEADRMAEEQAQADTAAAASQRAGAIQVAQEYASRAAALHTSTARKLANSITLETDAGALPRRLGFDVKLAEVYSECAQLLARSVELRGK